MIPLGLHFDIPADQYHADDSSVSNTMLSAMNKSPAHCYALHLAPDRPERVPTASMLAGTLAHTMILEPHAIGERYIAKPSGMDYRTAAGKAWRDSQTALIVDAEALSAADQQRIAVMRVKALANLLGSGRAEASAFWVDEATRMRCRARPDFMHFHGPKRATVVDIKTISDLTPEAVQRAISTYGYHRQEAHYTNGLRACGIEVEEFVFGFVSNSYPYLAAAFVLDDETKGQGRQEVAELLDLYATCHWSGNWPAFGDGYQLTGLPTWAKRNSEVEVSFVD
jgi:hypothetical protein